MTKADCKTAAIRQNQYLTKFGTDTAPQPQLNAAAGISEREASQGCVLGFPTAETVSRSNLVRGW